MNQGFNIKEIEKMEKITYLKKHSYEHISVLFEDSLIPIEVLEEIKNNCSEECEIVSIYSGDHSGSRISFKF